jgi:hypothetical protein
VTMKNFHKTIVVKHNGRRAKIDRGIAPLVLETWKAGIDTRHSCEDVGATSGDEKLKGWVSLGFSSSEDASNWFTTAVPSHKKGGTSGYNRATGCHGVHESVIWKWDVGIFDASYDWQSDVTHDAPYLDFNVSVMFPPDDLPGIMQKLMEYNRNSLELSAAFEKLRMKRPIDLDEVRRRLGIANLPGSPRFLT